MIDSNIYVYLNIIKNPAFSPTDLMMVNPFPVE